MSGWVLRRAGRVSLVKRRLVLTIGALVAAGSLSSCSTFDHPDVAATVNGHELTRDELDRLADGTGSPVSFRTALTVWARLVLIEGDAYRTTPSTSDEVNERISAALPTLQRTEADGELYYSGGPAATGLACLSAIQANDEAKAQAAAAAIADGKSFSEAATTYSDDPALAESGGVLIGQDGSDCIAVEQFSPALLETIAGLRVGEPTDVLPLGEAYVLIVARPWAELLPASQQLLISAAPPQQVRDGDVTIASRFGAWNQEKLTVEAASEG